MCSSAQSTSTVDVEADGLVTIHTSEIRTAIRNAKAEALERAAQRVEKMFVPFSLAEIAAIIRALKDKPP